MKENVIIKTNRFGLLVTLNPDIPFETLLEDVKRKFSASARFFAHAAMVVTFSGRELSREEEDEMVFAISESGKIEIVCIYDTDTEVERLYGEIVHECSDHEPKFRGKFFRGSLKDHQLLEIDSSVVILGDVEHGAVVRSAGNVIVLGTIWGNVQAGTEGCASAFIIALGYNPQHLQIADISLDDVFERKSDHAEAKIVYLKDGEMFIDTLKGDRVWAK